MANTTIDKQSLFSMQSPKTDTECALLLALIYGGVGFLLLLVTALIWIILYLISIIQEPWVQKIYLQNGKHCPIWLHQSKIRNRHIHLPISDLFRLFSLVAFRIAKDPFSFKIRRLGRIVSQYRREIYPLIALDFDFIDDPTWPDRSLIHTIMLFSCAKCSQDDGVYLVTTSLLQHTTWTTYIGRSHIIKFASFDDIHVDSIQSGGLIFIHVQSYRGNDLLIHDMRQATTRSIDVSSVFDEDTSPIWFLGDDGHDWGDVQAESSIYVRAIYIVRDMQQRTCYGHCLLRISADDQVDIKIMEEIDGPFPWDNCIHYTFRTSTCLGIFAKIDDSDDGIGNIGKPFTIYDLKSRRMMALREIEPLLVDDRPIRLMAQSYFECDDTTSLQDLFMDQKALFAYYLSLNDREGMLLDHRKRIWTTRFQPATLKFICLREMFQSFKCRYTAQDWKRVAGIDLEKHFH